MSDVERDVEVPAQGATLKGMLRIPAGATGLAIFAHGTGSNRLSSRNGFVADALFDAGFGSLLFDLVDEGEANAQQKASDMELLGERMLDAARWARDEPDGRGLPLGYYGGSTGAAVALIAAAAEPELAGAVVSRGGRTDLAEAILGQVQAPTLLIVGENDTTVLRINRVSLPSFTTETDLEVVPGASHLFEEPGTLDEVARLTKEWYARFLVPPDDAAAGGG